MVPVELMGRTHFPSIGDTPYLLTLAGYAFYWFSVEAPHGPSPREPRPRLITPTLSINNLDELLAGTGRARLESILPPFLEAQGWLAGTVNRARIVDTERMESAVPTFLVFIHVEYAGGDAETFMVPLIALAYDPDLAQFVGDGAAGSQGTLVANLRLQGDIRTTPSYLLVFAASEGTGRIFLDAISTGASFRTRTGTIVAEKMAEVTIDPGVCEARILSSNPFAASIAYGRSFVVRLFYRNEEGAAPEIEVARFLQEKNLTVNMPRLLGWVEHRAPGREPITLAMLEEQIANEGTAWQQARGELDRAYEHVLARPATEPPPTIPPDPLISLVSIEPPETHRELMGTYSAWAEKLGTRVAGFHLALATSLDPAFEPAAYSAADQWSRYQAGRSLTGRTLSALRYSLDELPTPERKAAELVLAAEAEILNGFEPLKSQTLEVERIRIHGDLHLDRVLFTGKDFVLLGPGATHRRRLAERKRKATALRDVASMIRSFEYAAAIALESLRPEDHARAEPWSRVWARWASAPFLRGYLQTAGNAPFLARDPATTGKLLDIALLGQALRDLQMRLRRHASLAFPLSSIVCMLQTCDWFRNL
jgi:maltose alpha-D-glucosyltransferase/alpha-amylase